MATARAGQPAAIPFVSPIVSAMVAAECARSGGARGFEPATKQVADYARTVGLEDAIAGKVPTTPARSGLAGRSYSPLARLVGHAEVEAATDLVAECLHHQLRDVDKLVLDEICRVIGELHDNVASHSRGAGFSALQVYAKPQRVEVAVVDNGVGLLRNAQRVRRDVQTHADAIHWSFQQGTTSASTDDLAQRLPEDAIVNPYPRTVETRYTENHHQGEGLWQLLQLVGHLGGELWVLTGDTEMLQRFTTADPSEPSYSPSAVHWTGLAIEITLPVSRDASPWVGDDREFARRLGL